MRSLCSNTFMLSRVLGPAFGPRSDVWSARAAPGRRVKLRRLLVITTRAIYNAPASNDNRFLLNTICIARRTHARTTHINNSRSQTHSENKQHIVIIINILNKPGVTSSIINRGKKVRESKLFNCNIRSGAGCACATRNEKKHGALTGYCY